MCGHQGVVLESLDLMQTYPVSVFPLEARYIVAILAPSLFGPSTYVLVSFVLSIVLYGSLAPLQLYPHDAPPQHLLSSVQVQVVPSDYPVASDGHYPGDYMHSMSQCQGPSLKGGAAVHYPTGPTELMDCQSRFPSNLQDFKSPQLPVSAYP